MQNPIHLLEQIQKIDLEVKSIEDEEKGYLRNIENVSQEIARARQATEAASAEVEVLKAQIREIDERISQSQDKISKDEKKMSAVKNDRELSAITKEINGANKAKKQSEQEKANLNNKFQEKSAKFLSAQTVLNEKEAELERLNRELEEKRPGWKGTVEEKSSARSSVTVNVRPEILKMYEAIRSKRAGIGLVLVAKEICQGCFTHIPPQVYIQLQKGTQEIVTCPHCHRILYVEGPSSQLVEAV